jgi:segregation and condensation protein B
MVDRNEADPQSHSDPDEDLGLEQFESVAGDQGISLDELSKAYAELIGKGDDPYERPRTEGATGVEQVGQGLDAPGDDEPYELCPKSIIEAILFVGHPRNEPISAEKLASLMRGVPKREVGELIDELNADYRDGEHPFHIVMRGAGYRLELREEFAALRNVFYGRVREARLSQSVIDVLAIVAYQQGCTRKEVEVVRGRPSGGILAQLVRRRLLRVERPEQKPRTPRYFVTDRFLHLFGLTDIEELPQSQDVD